MKKLISIILAFGLLATPVLAETRVDGVEYGTVGEMRVKRYGDTLKALLDGTDAYMKWSDGDLYLQTDEGTNTNSGVYVKGKGTGQAFLELTSSNTSGNTALFLARSTATSATGANAGLNIITTSTGGDPRIYFTEGTVDFAIGIDNTDSLFKISRSGNLGTNDALSFSSTETVVNDAGADVDFRVEGDTNANLFHIDAGLEAVGIGGVAVTGQALTITQNSDTLAFINDGTDSYMKWSDGNLYLMSDEGTNPASYVWIKGKGTGPAYLVLQDSSSANYATYFDQTDGIFSTTFGTAVTEYVMNQGGTDVDFRVESDTITHAIALDAGTNAVTLSAPNSATTPAANATLSFWIDESNHDLKVAVKYADGTAKTATVAFD